MKEAILNMTAKEIVIMLALPGGHVGHYSKGTKLNGCIPRILASPCIEDDGFIGMLWQNSLGHMAFNDGVWSFDERRLLSSEQARQKQEAHVGCHAEVGCVAPHPAVVSCNIDATGDAGRTLCIHCDFVTSCIHCDIVHTL